jgi:hypothetical protein
VHILPPAGRRNTPPRLGTAARRYYNPAMVFCDLAHGNPATGSILVQASAQEGPMRTEVDLTKLTVKVKNPDSPAMMRVWEG